MKKCLSTLWSHWALLISLPVFCYGCTLKEQHAITRCAQPLYDVGAFQADKESQSFTWDFFAKKTRNYFYQVCKNFRRFEYCIEPYEIGCFQEEPVKSQYSTATVVLDYLCGDAHQEMINRFDCFATVLTNNEMLRCQSGMVHGMQAVENTASHALQERQICQVMKDYMGCIKQPLRKECGFRAWNVVREVVQRPTSLVMPGCILNTASIPFLSSCLVLLLPLFLLE